MTVKKESYEQDGSSNKRKSKVVGLGLVSAASAVVGGLAVAWWYRKTLAKLQNPIATADFQNPEPPETEQELPKPVD